MAYVPPSTRTPGLKALRAQAAARHEQAQANSQSQRDAERRAIMRKAAGK